MLQGRHLDKSSCGVSFILLVGEFDLQRVADAVRMRPSTEKRWCQPFSSKTTAVHGSNQSPEAVICVPRRAQAQVRGFSDIPGEVPHSMPTRAESIPKNVQSGCRFLSMLQGRHLDRLIRGVFLILWVSELGPHRVSAQRIADAVLRRLTTETRWPQPLPSVSARAVSRCRLPPMLHGRDSHDSCILLGADVGLKCAHQSYGRQFAGSQLRAPALLTLTVNGIATAAQGSNQSLEAVSFVQRTVQAHALSSSATPDDVPAKLVPRSMPTRSESITSGVASSCRLLSMLQGMASQRNVVRLGPAKLAPYQVSSRRAADDVARWRQGSILRLLNSVRTTVVHVPDSTRRCMGALHRAAVPQLACAMPVRAGADVVAYQQPLPRQGSIATLFMFAGYVLESRGTLHALKACWPAQSYLLEPFARSAQSCFMTSSQVSLVCGTSPVFQAAAPNRTALVGWSGGALCASALAAHLEAALGWASVVLLLDSLIPVPVPRNALADAFSLSLDAPHPDGELGEKLLNSLFVRSSAVPFKLKAPMVRVRAAPELSLQCRAQFHERRGLEVFQEHIVDLPDSAHLTMALDHAFDISWLLRRAFAAP